MDGLDVETGYRSSNRDVENGDVARKWSDESRISIRNCSDYSIEQLVSSQSGSMVVPPPLDSSRSQSCTYFLFFFIFLHVRDVGRLKRHKLERSISRQMRGWRVSVQYGRQTWPSFHIVQLFRSDQIVELFIDISQIVRYVFEAM